MANPNTAKYPSQLATDSDLPVATGGFSTVLTADIDFSTATIPVGSIAADVPVLLRIENEIILAVNKSGSNFTSCVRGFSGTTAVSHLSGAQVFGYIFAHHFNQLAAEVKAIETALGANLANIPPTLAPSPAGTYGDASNYPVVTVDSKGRVTTVTTQAVTAPAKDFPQYFMYRAAIAQGSVASLAFSMKTTNQPTATVISYTNNIFAVADFPAAGAEEMWEHFFVPDDFKANSTIEVQFRWFSADTTGNVQWAIDATTVDETESLDIAAWTWSQTVTETVQGVASRLNYSAISINTTGSTIAGKEFVFKISRGTDTATSVARLFDVRFKLIRTV